MLSIIILLVIYIICYMVYFPECFIYIKQYIKRKELAFRKFLSNGFNQPLRL